MRVSFYFDDNIAMKPVVVALRERAIEVTTADYAGNRGIADVQHLEFAGSHGFAVVTADEGDFAALHWDWLRQGRSHCGIIVVRQRTSIGDLVRALSKLHDELSAESIRDGLVYLSRYG